MNSLQQISSSVAKSVALFTSHMNSLRSRMHQTKSHASQGSKTSKSEKSNLSQVSSKFTQKLIQHTTKVEQARAQMKYAEEEAELIRQEAVIKASRTVLTCKKELEATKQGLEAVRKVLEFSDVDENVFGEYQNHDNDNLTERYVNENMRMTIPPPDPVVSEIPSAAVVNAHDINVSEPTQNSLNSVVPQVLQQTNTKQDTAFDLAKAVVKHQMIPQRLWKFSGESGRYITWKHSFLNVMKDINSSPLEQLDLLLNNFGQGCKLQCENIRTTNARNPEKALTLIWERLDLEYGSPEAVEHAMKQRIINFTLLTENDRKRYFDLFDLAAEVDSLKSDESYGSSFAYFDSSTGINDFVRKLPKRFREKWMRTCDKYKVINGVSHVSTECLMSHAIET